MNKYKAKAFTQFGPPIATGIILLVILLLTIFNDPTAFIELFGWPDILARLFGLISLAATSIIIGYILGCIPAVITEQLFLKIINHHPEQLQYSHYIKTGFYTALIWVLPSLLIGIFFNSLWLYALFYFVLCLLTTLICSHIIAKRDMAT